MAPTSGRPPRPPPTRTPGSRAVSVQPACLPHGIFAPPISVAQPVANRTGWPVERVRRICRAAWTALRSRGMVSCRRRAGTARQVTAGDIFAVRAQRRSHPEIPPSGGAALSPTAGPARPDELSYVTAFPKTAGSSSPAGFPCGFEQGRAGGSSRRAPPKRPSSGIGRAPCCVHDSRRGPCPCPPPEPAVRKVAAVRGNRGPIHPISLALEGSSGEPAEVS